MPAGIVSGCGEIQISKGIDTHCSYKCFVKSSSRDVLSIEKPSVSNFETFDFPKAYIFVG